MTKLWEIDSWVERKALSLIKSFYPTVVSRETDLPLPIVFERLLELVKDEQLILKWEIRCPNCFFSYEHMDEFPIINGQTIECPHCGEEFELTTDAVFPVFEITPSYKSYVREKRDKLKKKFSNVRKKKGSSKPAPLNTPDLLSPKSVELLKEISPGFSRSYQLNPDIVNIINIESVGSIGSVGSMSKYDFKGAKIEYKDGTLAIGENQTITNTVIKSTKETHSFKDEIDKSDLPAEKKKEVKEAIDFVEKEIKGKNPNKTVLKGVMDSIKSTIGLVTTSASLVTAYEKWNEYVQPLIDEIGK